jgi:hypothetical protein
MVYVPVGRKFKVKTGKLSGTKIVAWWFNPRNGNATRLGAFDKTPEREFVPADVGEMTDWVLVLDDEARKYPPPGEVTP